MTCSRGCCATQQEHYRSLQVNMNIQIDRKKNKELDLYKQARMEGSQPAGTRTEQTHHAMAVSDKLGRAYRADDLATTYHPEIAAQLKPLTDAQKDRARKIANGQGS